MSTNPRDILVSIERGNHTYICSCSRQKHRKRDIFFLALRRFRDLTITLLSVTGELVYKSPIINALNQLKGPAQINHVIAGNVRARFVRISRVGGLERCWGEGDRNVLSLVEVQVMTKPEPSSENERMQWVKKMQQASLVDIACIGRIEGGRARYRKKMKTRLKESGQPTASRDPGDLIVFIQDRFWRNDFLNLAIDRRPRVAGDYATRLQYSLIDYLKFRSSGKGPENDVK